MTTCHIAERGLGPEAAAALFSGILNRLRIFFTKRERERDRMLKRLAR